MQVIHYRHTDEKQVPTADVDRDSLRGEIGDEKFEDLCAGAGVDRYMNSVAFGRLTKDYRGHQVGALFVRWSNSQGICYAIEDNAKPTESPEELERLQKAKAKADAAAKGGGAIPPPEPPPTAGGA